MEAGYPKCKYHADNLNGLVVEDSAEEKVLGADWYDHPSDARAGRVLSNVERGGGVAPKVEPQPEKKSEAKKEK